MRMLSASSASVTVLCLVGLLSPSALSAAPSQATAAPTAAPAAESAVPAVELPSIFPEPLPGLVDSDTEGDASSDVEGLETANYSDGEISIDYPVTWEVEVDEAGDVAIANIPAIPSERVETQIFRVASPPGPLVDANIDSFIEEGSAVSRYRSVTIDDQSALVIWLSDRPEDLTSAIATFIDYGDNTIMLFSRYDPENTAAENSILRLHGSFSNVSVPAEAAGLEGTDPEATDPEAPASESMDLAE